MKSVIHFEDTKFAVKNSNSMKNLGQDNNTLSKREYIESLDYQSKALISSENIRLLKKTNPCKHTMISLCSKGKILGAEEILYKKPSKFTAIVMPEKCRVYEVEASIF